MCDVVRSAIRAFSGLTDSSLGSLAVDEMAASGVMLLRDCEKHRAIAQAACTRVREEFCAEKIVPMYEECYRSVVGG